MILDTLADTATTSDVSPITGRVKVAENTAALHLTSRSSTSRGARTKNVVEAKRSSVTSRGARRAHRDMIDTGHHRAAAALLAERAERVIAACSWLFSVRPSIASRTR